MSTAPSIASVTPWRSPPDTCVLDDDEVHVWRVALDQTPAQRQHLFDYLAADEQGRAERLYFQKDREHFIVARGVLRAILGGYVQQAPDGVSFGYGPHGKPVLAGTSDRGAIRFSVSHSHGVALYAMARGREVGVDLERIRGNLEVAEIAERFFSPREVAMLRRLPAGAQRQAFFHCWTRKEAYIKARGEGLSLPLDQFEVSLAPGEPAALLGTPYNPPEAARWSLQELTPARGYAAALAVAGHGWRLTAWQWPAFVEPSAEPAVGRPDR